MMPSQRSAGLEPGQMEARPPPRPTRPPADPRPAEPQAPPEDSLLAASSDPRTRSRLTIVDTGAQHGETTEESLVTFPSCRVIALEPASANHARLRSSHRSPIAWS